MANTNLFYNLYSNSNNVTQSPFTCTSAVDEEDTSFNITAGTNGAIGTITDSNGKTLASVDLDSIHAAGITQYNVETRILKPLSCYVLQGLEYGLSYAKFWFEVPYQLFSTETWLEYTQCEFDIIYNNFTPYKFHIDAMPKSAAFTLAINELLATHNIPVVVSLQTKIGHYDHSTHYYLVFTSTELGYFYYINNLKLVPLFRSENYPYSPFSSDIENLNLIAYDLIVKYHPVQEDEKYDEQTYEPNCELYSWIINYYENITERLHLFRAALDKLQLININEMDNVQIDEILAYANNKIANTAFDQPIIDKYDITNMEVIYNLLYELKQQLSKLTRYYKKLYWLYEAKDYRISLMKYPNGAFRGICIIPDWPTNDSSYEQYSTLWVNHIKNEVILYKPKNGHQGYYPHKYGVLSNATIMGEEEDFKEKNKDFKSIDQPRNSIDNIPDGYLDKLGYHNTLDTNYIDPYRPDHSIYEDTMYMGLNCYSSKSNIIGLFRYMQYVNDNKLWNPVGQGYMIIGNEDSIENRILNLPHSVIIYNPNPVPIRIKYLIFS